ncbi:MAG: hypothetical protein AAF242_15935, partial [Bacteroidota bacterium]
QGTEVTPTYRFQDGIYLSFEEFQRNQPALKWDQFIRRSVTNPQSLITQVDFIRYRNSQEKLDINKIWGICLDGLPFVRIDKDSIHKELSTFAGLRLAGNICYYSYENRVEKEYDIAAYNPLNGEPFRRATVSRMVTNFVEKIFTFEEGGLKPFDKNNIYQLMEDDPELRGKLNELRPTEAEYQEKLFRLMMAYNRRHPVYFK